MGTYNLPRNVKGEGRILFIFTPKSMMWSAGMAMIGLIPCFIFMKLNMTILGVIILAIFALLGYSIGMFKVPNIHSIKWARINAGENIDDVIKRAIKFKHKGNKIYIYKEDTTNDK